MKLYIELLLTGVALGWGPCFSLCAPLAVPYILATQKNWRGGLTLSLAFSLARIIPYIIFGSISATVGQYLVRRFYEGQAKIITSIAVGVFICLLGVLILIGKSPYLHLCPAVKKAGPGGVKEMFALGLLLGLAPCLPLLAVLAYIAMHADSLIQGALSGLSFGLGTLISPLVLCGPLAGGLALVLQKKPMVYNIFSRLCGLMLMYLGIGMIIKTL